MKIVSRKTLVLDQLVPVYDLTSPKHHNFVLGNGAVVHNSAKRARDASFQEVLPLRGKIPNAFGAKADIAFANEEILSMLIAIGYDPSEEDAFSKLRVGKLIILTDSDVDGMHIQNLILAAILKFVPQLLADGRVYISQRYEYLCQYKGQVWFAETREELESLAPKAAWAYTKHLKGLGEVDAEVLADMAFNPERRKMIQLSPITRKELTIISDLAGTDSSFRKELLGV